MTCQRNVGFRRFFSYVLYDNIHSRCALLPRYRFPATVFLPYGMHSRTAGLRNPVCAVCRTSADFTIYEGAVRFPPEVSPCTRVPHAC